LYGPRDIRFEDRPEPTRPHLPLDQVAEGYRQCPNEIRTIMTHTVGFIGSGAIASALARLSVAATLNVIMSNSRGPETLIDLVRELGDHA
jgi:phosphoglycerate dehydrogenase-like enzyme